MAVALSQDPVMPDTYMEEKHFLNEVPVSSQLTHHKGLQPSRATK